MEPLLSLVRASPGQARDEALDDDSDKASDRASGASSGASSDDSSDEAVDRAWDDRELVAGLRAREPWATPALIERYGNHIRRVLLRVLGHGGGEHVDVFQEVVTGAWEGIGQLNDANALKAWLTRIAVFTARSALRSRSRGHWLSFFEEVPEVEAAWAGPELREAARAVYEILDRLPIDERIPFALRTLEDLDLDATAHACGVSPATVRRRLIKAQRRFLKLARQYEALRPWVDLPVDSP